MRILKTIFALVIIISFAFSCTPPKKEMSLEEFAKIEKEINLPDPEVNPELVEKVVKKHGFTYDQYKTFFDKVQKDNKMMEKLGELRLGDKKEDKK